MSEVTLNNFVPRPYQYDLCQAFESKKFKRFLIVWPRRAGKDICAFNLLLRAALRKVGTYFYVFPTFSMGRRILWDAIDISGNRIIFHYAPDSIVQSRNEVQMRIRLINGSQIQILGSDDVDKSLVGTNALGIVFSEYAMQDSRAWLFSIPILKASDGWALFASTPRGKNSFYDLYKLAQDSDNWFCQKLTVDDTKHVSIDQIKADIKNGEMSEDLSLQEWWTSFELGVEGSYYGKYIDDMMRKGQIGRVMYEPYLPVYTAWDLGYNDPTCIIFFQLFGNQVRIIDYYENNKKGLDHYAAYIKTKDYVYQMHIAPFDIAVHDLITGESRWNMMHELGITFMKYSSKPTSIDDGIEGVRKSLPRIWIDEEKCKPLIQSLQNYRQEYDIKKRIYRSKPCHDQYSHGADAMRYLCYSLPLLTTKSDPKKLEERYNEAMYGGDSNLPAMFRNDQYY